MDENCHALLGWHPTLSKLSHLSIKDGSLFVCLSCWNLPILGTSWCVLGIVGKLSMSRGAGRVHWHGFIMYRPILQELLNIEKKLTKKSAFNQNLKFDGNWVDLLELLKTLDELDFLEVIVYFLDLIVRKYWILINFHHWKLIKILR